MIKPLLCLLASLAASSLATAQIPGLGGGLPTTAPGADFATYARLFGKHTAFTARTEVRVVDKHQKETVSTGMDFAMLDGKLRLEIDATAARSTTMPPGAADSLKQMGMDQVQVIMRPDRQTVYYIFPKARMFITLPMDKADLEKAEKSTIQTESLGKETLDAQPCQKQKITITSARGEKQELTVWKATQLKDMPIQTIQKDGDDTITTRYTKIQFTRPDASQFEPPAGFEEFKGMGEFMQGMMRKALSGGLPTGQ